MKKVELNNSGSKARDASLISSRGRDISLVSLDSKRYLVIGCDSIGGIGPKEKDSLQVSGRVVGGFASRVPLMEVKAVGARIISVVDTLAVEYDPAGKEIISGIRHELETIGLDPGKLINGSTEENVKTTQTGVGVTITGLIDKSKLRTGISRPGDLVMAVGSPEVGAEVLKNEEVITDLNDLITLLGLDFGHEILPVGSKGIKYEAELLAGMSGMNCQFRNEIELDMKKSAGPGTVLLVTVPEKYQPELERNISKPLTVIGELI